MILRTIAWVAAVVYSTIPSYWLLVHPRAARWAARGGRRLMLIGPVWLILWVVAGSITWPWRLVTFYDTRWTWVPGGLLIATGLVIYGFAYQNFSADQLLGRAELEPHKHVQALSTRGIRAHIRHPYYLGHLCELIGWAAATGLVVVYALTVFAVITGHFMIKAEERELAQRFPDYSAYQARTAAMFPGVW